MKHLHVVEEYPDNKNGFVIPFAVRPQALQATRSSQILTPQSPLGLQHERDLNLRQERNHGTGLLKDIKYLPCLLILPLIF